MFMQATLSTNFANYLTGVKLLQEYVFNNIYKKALQDEKHTIRLQVFRLVLCGVPRSGKTTFWKRIAIEDFKPSKVSTSTGAAETHYLSVQEKKDDPLQESSELSPSAGIAESVQGKNSQEPNVHTEMLFDLHLYSEDKESDLDREALTIYKRILENKPQPKEVHQNVNQDKGKGGNGVQLADDNEKDVDNKPETRTNVNQVEAANSLQSALNSADKDKTTQPANSNSQQNHSAQSEIHAASSAVNQQPRTQLKMPPSDLVVVVKKLPSDPIVVEIDKCFKHLNDLLRHGKELPDIPTIKKMCHLQDIGGQKAFLQLLPTVSTGKALYLLFFKYKDFVDTSVSETVQMKGSPDEVPTGAAYEQMHIIMQSLICVSSTKSSDNVALLVGTHVDKVQSEDDISRVNNVIYEKVKPFLSSNILMYAKNREDKVSSNTGDKKREEEKESLVLKVATNNNNELNCHEPEDYKKVVMHIVDKKLKCPESEALPASWYMFSIILRKIKHAGYSVLQDSHCKRIADELDIQESKLPGLLSRLHKVLGIVLYFPTSEIKGLLEDIVICDPAFIYKSISELIFKTFDDCTNAPLSRRLKKWGMFKYEELEKHCQVKKCHGNLEMKKLIILLQHLGIIAPVQNSTQTAVKHNKHEDNAEQSDIQNSTTTVKCVNKDDAEHSDAVHSEYLIPCVLNDAMKHELEDVQIQDTQACSIVPLRIYFECGFAPMGGFCYLFTKLISNRKRWKIRLPDELEDENNIYWRNKVTFIVTVDSCRYFVTLLSTNEYYEIHIIHSGSFQLGIKGRSICKEVWEAIHTILENSLNESLHNYKTACICTTHPKSNHVMKFNCKPHEIESQVKAQCMQTKSDVLVEDIQPSIVVWFKVHTIYVIYYLECYIMICLFQDSCQKNITVSAVSRTVCTFVKCSTNGLQT